MPDIIILNYYDIIIWNYCDALVRSKKPTLVLDYKRQVLFWFHQVYDQVIQYGCFVLCVAPAPWVSAHSHDSPTLQIKGLNQSLPTSLPAAPVTSFPGNLWASLILLVNGSLLLPRAVKTAAVSCLWSAVQGGVFPQHFCFRCVRSPTQ